MWSRVVAHAAQTEGKLEHLVENEVLMEIPVKWQQRRRGKKSNLNICEERRRRKGFGKA